ncbi:MAG: acyltransferase family protein [Planctomycetota bacterium]|jgi:peptidoglycan/LPS O-acetylase OafA/YrhL
MPPLDPSTGGRRHDLDALRATAMLLGIVLHGLLSMAPLPWLIEDDVQSKGLFFLYALIHIARMPLFFLLSGYFTLMLWQRRGLLGLLKQRAMRIALPLAVAIFTVLPLLGLSVVAAWAIAEDTWSSVDEDTRSSVDDVPSALHFAAGNDDVARCVELLDRGAELEAGDERGSTPLQWAVYFGRADAALVLIERGADLDSTNLDGRSPAMELREPWTKESAAMCGFLASLLQLDLDLDEVPRGRARIADALELDGVPSPASIDARIDSDDPADERGPTDLAHLWFLWYLLLLTLGFAPVLALLGPVLKRLPETSASAATMLVMVPATAYALMAMSRTSPLPVYGPTTSTTFDPDPAILGFYGLFFAFGGLLRAADPQTRRLTRRWPIWLGLALIAFPMSLHATFEVLEGESLSAWGGLLQATTCWGLVIGSIGFFQRLLARERRWVRLISDSSYWIYLMHLPLVIVLQGVVSHWEQPAAVKLGLICATTFTGLFGSYLLLVRPTPIGWLLNGRQRQAREPRPAIGEPGA